MTSTEVRRGIAAALAAYIMWGTFGLYFRAIDMVPPLEVLAHRILGGSLFTLAALALSGGLGEIRTLLQDRHQLKVLLASAFCISSNWGVYIWSVTHGHAIDASLGFYIFPLISVLTGRLLLGEHLSRRRLAAVAIVFLGVAWLAATGAGMLWVPLYLAVTLCAYSLLRKTVQASPLGGLCVETLLLAPLAIGYLITQNGGIAPSASTGEILLLSLAGPVTAIPLSLFAYGAKRLPLSTLGLMIYINPTMQMVLAVFVFGEPFLANHAIAFAAIWSGLALYSWPVRTKAVATAV